MKIAKIVVVSLVGIVPAAALAQPPVLHVDPTLKDCSVKFAPVLSQAAFHHFVREFGSVSAFKQVAPPAPLGRGGVELGLEQISFTVDEKSPTWNDTFAHPSADHYLGSRKSFPKASLRVGVTDQIDVGAYYTRNPDANYGWFGLDVRDGLLRQGQGRPVDLAVRGAYTKTLYIGDMNMNAFTADVSVGRTYWKAVRPYVGLGGDLVLGRETSSAVDLKSETEFVPRAFAGLGYRFWHVALGVEGEMGALNRLEVQVAGVR
jgi:hypothetical protein